MLMLIRSNPRQMIKEFARNNISSMVCKFARFKKIAVGYASDDEIVQG